MNRALLGLIALCFGTSVLGSGVEGGAQLAAIEEAFAEGQIAEARRLQAELAAHFEALPPELLAQQEAAAAVPMRRS